MSLTPRGVHVFDQLDAHMAAVATSVVKYHKRLIEEGMSEAAATQCSVDYQRRLMGEIDRAIEAGPLIDQD